MADVFANNATLVTTSTSGTDDGSSGNTVGVSVLNQWQGTTVVNGLGAPSHFSGNGAPGTVGIWNARVGDRYTDQAATGGYTEYRCTTAGNPGTWTGLI